MNKASYADLNDKEILKVLYHQRLSFSHENYIEYYFNNEYKNDLHYVLKDDNNNILCYINRHPLSLRLGDKNVAVSLLRNFIYEDKKYLHELLEIIEDHLIHQELITLIDDKEDIFNLDVYSAFNIFEFEGIDFDVSSNMHLSEIVEAEELLKIYAAFVKRFNGYEIRDLKYFENKIKENIATGSKYLIYREDDKVYGYAHLYNNTVDEIIYFKKNVINEILTYLFVNYDFVSIKTSSLEAINNAYHCHKTVKTTLKYQINDYDLMMKLYSLTEEEVLKLTTSNIFCL